ncbi:Abi family protein [Curtobacterium sp. Leaf261]|uniref:Abi family protein n=1 Tax=Curtobacterium sp. Leaf261 TaxID=1736311 RepID=UPI001F39373C|nr:Abi family protein [Curtobacterium sp. Leaf261]
MSEQIALLASRGLIVDDVPVARDFLRVNNYYRFSGYARPFQNAPHLGDDSFRLGTTFHQVSDVYDADDRLRSSLVQSLTRVELMLRTHFARVVADDHGPYRSFLEQRFYTDVGPGEPTAAGCVRDVLRSRDRHILRHRDLDAGAAGLARLPVWSAVEAWSFGTLSKAIERGAGGTLADDVAASAGVAKAGFASRIRTLVYLRNRCAHHGRLWHHSVLDAGPTPNNVRSKAKRSVGQFEPRSVIDVVASLDDFVVRSGAGSAVLGAIVERHAQGTLFWDGLVRPQGSRDHTA